MNLPKHAGRYIAAPKQWGVSQQGTNQIPTFVCQFDLRQWSDGDQWIDISPEALEISGYFFIFKKDGQPNTFTIEALKESLGWDGASLATLNDSDWSQTEVQLQLGFEDYEGKSRIKVQFINARDSAPGGVTKADPQEIRSLDAKYGPMLRAVGGTTKAAAKPNGKAIPPGGMTVESAKQEAWKAFQTKWNEFVKEHPEEAPNRDAKWKEVFQEQFPGGDPKALGVVQWKALREVIEKNWSPELGLIPFD